MNAQGYFIPPHARPHFVTHFQYSAGNRLFSAPECDAIIALGTAAGFGQAAVGNPDNARIDADYRSAAVAMVEYSPQSAWLYERITQRVQGANDHFFFDLSGLLEGLQVIQYDPQPDSPGRYQWHHDFGGGYMACRKLSLCAQLSDPADYDGCRLTIMDPHPRELENEYIERGAGVIFPSWTPHCVTPITRGRRYSLVAWVHGAPFR